jgi:hypothetical protein
MKKEDHLHGFIRTTRRAGAAGVEDFPKYAEDIWAKVAGLTGHMLRPEKPLLFDEIYENQVQYFLQHDLRECCDPEDLIKNPPTQQEVAMNLILLLQCGMAGVVPYVREEVIIEDEGEEMCECDDDDEE